MSKIIIHIGLGKTGTTAIQNFLHLNREALLEKGVDYTKIGFYERGFAHHTLSHKWGGWIPEEKITDSPDEAWDQLAAYAGETDKTIVISSERFAGLSTYNKRYGEFLGFIREKLAGIDVEIIGYIRRQDDLAESMYKQGLKAGFVEKPIERYINRLPATLKFCDFFDRWAEFFGTENVQACIYDRACFVNGDLVQDFFHATGLTYPENPAQSEKHQNPSIGTVSARILSDLSMSRAPQDKLKQAARLAFDALVLDDPVQNYLLDGQQRRAIMERYEKSNTRLIERYVRRDPGDAFATDRYADRGAFDPDRVQFSYAQMLQFTKELIRRL